MDGRVRLRSLELHVTHACNLACDDCAHFSNFGLKGHVTPAEADGWLAAWSHRVKPGAFALLGGEPTSNPRLVEFLPIVRKHWSSIPMQLVTNGWFLDRHPELPAALKRHRIRLSISIHHHGPTYLEKIREIRALVGQWRSHYSINVDFRPSWNGWKLRHRETPRKEFNGVVHGHPSDIMPYTDGNPAQSWRNCGSKWCMQLYDHRLWKCPQVAYLPQVARQFGLGQREAWSEVLGYKGLDPECTESELRAFAGKRTESVCAGCPAEKHFVKINSPIRGVVE